MHARVWQLRIQPGKLEEFTAAIQSLVPLARQQGGFRGVLVLRTNGKERPEAMVIAVWDSLQDLRKTEHSMFVTQALARVLSCCEGFPSIRESEVLVSEFAAY